MKFYVITGEQWEALNYAVSQAQVYAPEKNKDKANTGREALSGAVLICDEKLVKRIVEYTFCQQLNVTGGAKC